MAGGSQAAVAEAVGAGGSQAAVAGAVGAGSPDAEEEGWRGFCSRGEAFPACFQAYVWWWEGARGGSGKRAQSWRSEVR